MYNSVPFNNFNSRIMIRIRTRRTSSDSNFPFNYVQPFVTSCINKIICSLSKYLSDRFIAVKQILI